MKTPNLNLFKLSLLVILLIFISSCSSDDENLTVNITVNEGPLGDIGGDFTGNGGDGSRTIAWENSLSTADYNADITSSATGTFNLRVTDANGDVVLDRNLNGDSEPDSFSGVTEVGEPGNWSVIITLSSFSGDGSYSLSEGD
ncbi:MAG: hypothetical protein HKN48_06900 [Flavobacteriaceae bacterium]|nr:hypothetical protein [Flavobacteriaceae bacterium]